ncbi:MATH and LRR domain-containing protein PFE0570w-like [Chenopodium quinoa]|uniref:MATH and LRR domain-containing protein PFE0570w-like n=1 Tax=Chenopodium quinoa TaxID=63459 RepID=UPI000B77ECF9|nr:MATH and LRR domain-containing protein PFE0570w-like [Chenopodium quinoa]
MKISVRISIFLLLPLLLATIIFLITTNFLSPIIHQDLLKKQFSTNLFLHLVFNFILIAIILKECYIQSCNKHDTSFSPLICFDYEMEEEHGEKKNNDDDEDLCDVYMVDKEGGDNHLHKGNDYYDDDDYYYHGSDGYDEDDDDNGSDGEVGWDEDDEEEEYDYDLERRIEAFIAKVINGWKEEWFSDNLND